MKRIIVIIFILIILLSSSIVFGTSPDYNIVLYPDKRIINLGEDITVRVYVVGEGKINDSSILFYTNDNFKISYRFSDGEWVVGTNSGVAAFWGESITKEIQTIAIRIPNNYLISVTELDHGKYKGSGVYITAKITNINLSGGHDLVGVLTYQDTEGNWHISKESATFHVKTPWERFWMLGTIVSILLALIGWTFAIIQWFKRKIEKQQQQVKSETTKEHTSNEVTIIDEKNKLDEPAQEDSSLNKE